MQYTVSQERAIMTIESNLQIIACAGSGKTQVISARIVELLKHGVKPAHIIAFTFTDKAAGELKDRIYRLCQDILGTQQGLADLFVGTLHGYCLHLLQSPPVYRFLKYSVLNDVQQQLFIDRYPQQSGLTIVPLLKGGQLHRWVDSRLYQQLLSILGEGQVKMEEVPTTVKKAVSQYHELRTKHCYLDYTTIMSEAVQEVQTNQELRSQLAEQIQYVVVDEYQDINPLQEKLIHELSDLGANLCVVGDDDQTIYQWRGSEVNNIITFADRYPQVEQIPLNENFRSSHGIVQAARHVVEKNPLRLPKKMESTQAQPYARGDILGLDFSDPQVEASWIVQKIRSLYGIPYQEKQDRTSRGLTYADFALLLRSVKNDATPLRAALEAAGIPYLIGGMNGLFETREIRAICAIFCYLADVYPPFLGDEVFTVALLKDTLAEAGLGLTPAQVAQGIDYLRETKHLIAQSNQRRQELYLQRVYLTFLERVGLREEAVSKNGEYERAGEIIFYNLGKFSQVISDFEEINFKSPPNSSYPSFANFLASQIQERSYYPEGWEEAGAAHPDAVQIMTVHQAKGRQWPVVFVPCLRKNRFPSRRQGGRSVWHILPETCVPNSEQYKGTVDDERRLFYVALTRAEKYVFCSWAPITENQQQRTRSSFLAELTGCDYVLTKEPIVSLPSTITPKGRRQQITLELTFSNLKYYFQCPYSFKLRFLYGFNPPIDQALGYGQSLHNALTEIHAKSLDGHIPSLSDIPRLVDEHMYLPYAGEHLEQILRQAGEEALLRYLRNHRQNLSRLEHVEKEIELKLADGIVVHGRIDLIRRTDTNEWVIVDFKTQRRSQVEDVSQKQLHIYAVGYQQLTGTLADLIEIHNMDDGGAVREQVNKPLMNATLEMVVTAGRQLRTRTLPRLPHWCSTCQTCDVAGICRNRPG